MSSHTVAEPCGPRCRGGEPQGRPRGNEEVVGSRRDVGGEARESWDSQSSEWEARRKSKATLPSPSSVQVDQSIVAAARRAVDELRRSSKTRSKSASNLKLISLALSRKSADFSKVISMIDEVVTLLKAEQSGDDGKKVYCIKSSGQTEDEGKVLARQIRGQRDAIAGYKDQLPNTNVRIESASLKRSSTSVFRK